MFGWIYTIIEIPHPEEIVTVKKIIDDGSRCMDGLVRYGGKIIYRLAPYMDGSTDRLAYHGGRTIQPVARELIG